MVRASAKAHASDKRPQWQSITLCKHREGLVEQLFRKVRLFGCRQVWPHAALRALAPGGPPSAQHVMRTLWAAPLVELGSTHGGLNISAHCACVRGPQVHATQFHPEKSGAAGLDMLRAFLDASDAALAPEPALPRHGAPPA